MALILTVSGCNIMFSKKELDKLLEEMPIIGQILGGFDRKIPNEANLHDDFRITIDQMLVLKRAIISSSWLPSTKEGRDDLMQTILTFGGCRTVQDKIEEAECQEKKDQYINSLRKIIYPIMDVRQEFDWIAIPRSDLRCGYNKTAHEQGFIMTGKTNDDTDPMFHFRRPKKRKIDGK